MLNLFCQYFGHSGDQKHGSCFVNALSELFDIALFPLDKPAEGTAFSRETIRALHNARGDCRNNISLGIGQMRSMSRLFGSYRVAFTVWETSQIPGRIREHLDSIDEIWVPSTWGQQNLIENGFSASGIHIVPEGVDIDVFRPRQKKLLARVDRPFRFLCVGKWEQRKGIDVLVDAFSKAFGPQDAVELLLHCNNPYIPGFDLDKQIAALHHRGHPAIRSSAPVSAWAMADIYNSCDAFVLPTRGEGWGLPIIEAMACAKPVIVTQHGAHCDFVNADNGFLIEVEDFVPVYDPLFFEAGLDYGRWASPSVDHLVELLRHVYRQPEDAAAKGVIAREQVKESWTWQHAACKAEKELLRISSHVNKRSTSNRKSAYSVSYLITFGNPHQSLLNCLRYLLGHLAQIPGLEVIVVEQGSQASLDINALPSHCYYRFVVNEDGFNKAWGINVCAQMATSDAYIIGSANIVVESEHISEISRRLRGNVDAINPADTLITLTREQTAQLIDSGLDLKTGLQGMNSGNCARQKKISLVEGVFAISRAFFRRIGGMDERFHGAGCDIALSEWIRRLSENIAEVPQLSAYRLDCETSASEFGQSAGVIRNRALLSFYNEMNREAFVKFCSIDFQYKKNRKKGSEPSSSENPHRLPLVSCLCVTRDRVEQLRRAINCFRQQTYLYKELVIICEDDDPATLGYVSTIEDENIRFQCVATNSKKSLGELRNISVEIAEGEYICQWDDDDWYDPRRVAAQLYQAMRSKKAAVIMCRWMIHDVYEEQFYCSNIRLWEGSLLCRKNFLQTKGTYDAVSRGEEGSLIRELFVRDQIAVVDSPDLYLYVYSKKNTWDENHFQEILQQSTSLSATETAELKQRLALSGRYRESGRIPKVIHQTAASSYLSPQFERFQHLIIEKHPEWEYRFYDNNECRVMISREMPELLAVYDKLALDIQRVDMFRLVAVFIYGGVYIDLDVEILEPLDELTELGCVFAEEKTLSDEACREFGHQHGLRVANYMFGAVPLHPFVGKLIRELVGRATGRDVCDEDDVLETTGPTMVTDLYHACGRDCGVTLLQKSDRKCPQCRAYSCSFGKFGRHYHSGSWRWQNGDRCKDGDGFQPVKLIHQSWKSRHLPPLFRRLSAGWKQYNPEWRHCLWTDEDNRQHIERHYPWFLELYEAYPHAIQRADAVRYFILYSVGGLYVDLDYRCCRSIAPLLHENEIVLGLEHPSHAQRFGRDNIIGNAFMYARFPGHPFFRELIEELALCRITEEDENRFVLETTGPLMLTRVYERHTGRKDITLLPSEAISPINSSMADLLLQSVAADDAFVNKTTAFAIHYHCGSWWKGQPG